jgi:hypothetical protein
LVLLSVSASGCGSASATELALEWVSVLAAEFEWA